MSASAASLSSSLVARPSTAMPSSMLCAQDGVPVCARCWSLSPFEEGEGAFKARLWQVGQ